MKKRKLIHPLIKQIMRITVIQSLLICIGISLGYAKEGHSQDLLDRSISIRIENAEIKTVLAQIEQQAKVEFIYSSNSIGAHRKISINATNKKLSEVLSTTLRPLKIAYKIVGGQIILQKEYDKQSFNISEQKEPVMIANEVSGKVTDSKGNGLPGVTVILKGSQQGTVSDGEGNYSMRVPDDNAILIFSFIGYVSQEVLVGNKTTLDIVLKDDEKSLDELVVIGYGKQSTRQMSSSVSTVSGKDFSDLPVAQFTQKLQGKMAGVQISQATGTPGAGMTVRIRGAASMNAGSEPLYVVDGNPIVGGISNINPNDIETISVLKDASASALYGSRAANGVVLIETVKAAPGETKINYSSYIGLQQVPQRGRPKMMNAQEFATWRKELAEERGLDVDPVFQNPQQYGEGTNWFNALTRNALMTDHSLSLATGTEKFSTAASAGILSQDGVVIGSGYKRYSLRVNTKFSPYKKVTIGLNIAPSYETNSNTGVDGVGGVFNEALQTSPLSPLRNPDGSYTLTAYSPGMFATPNYARTLTDRVADNRSTRILSNLYAEYQPIEGLYLKTSGNIDMGNSRNFTFNGTTTGTRGVGLYKVASSSLYQNSYMSWVNENTANYHKEIGDHNFDALVGFTAQKYRIDDSNTNGNNYPDDKVKTISAAGTITSTSGIQEWSLLSYLARLNYNYKGKYLFSASLRRDGSSRFGANNRWGNFPSVSLGWILSEESFMADVKAISFLKLRASYGVIGNFNIGNYTHIPTISTSNYVFGGSVAGGRRVDNLADQGIGWEANKQLNVGLDLNLFNDRINFTYNYYRKNTSDLLFNVGVPRASGYGNIQTNIGAMKFWGHEFSLSTTNIRDERIKWFTDFNMSFDRNQVTSLGNTAKLISGPGSGVIGGSNITIVGQPIGMLYGMKHLGVYKNQADFDSSPKHATSQVGTAKFQDTNNDGKIAVDDATIIGNPHPKFVFGMTNTVQYKNFDLSVTLTGSVGNDIVRGSEQTLTNLDGVFNVLADVKDRWRSPENPGKGRYGSLAAGTTGLERDWWGTQMLYKADYLSINNVSLGYGVPLNNTKGLKRLRIYASVQQLHIFTKYPGSNPQVSLSTGSTGLGIDGGSYPVPRTYSLGVNVGF